MKRVTVITTKPLDPEETAGHLHGSRWHDMDRVGQMRTPADYWAYEAEVMIRGLACEAGDVPVDVRVEFWDPEGFPWQLLATTEAINETRGK